jgi:hypothetical protein
MESLDLDDYIQITGYNIRRDEISEDYIVELISMGKPMLYLSFGDPLTYTLGKRLSGDDDWDVVILDIINKFNAKVCKFLIYDLKNKEGEDMYLSKMVIENIHGEEFLIEINLIAGYLIARQAESTLYVAKKLIPLFVQKWYETHAPDLCERLRNIDPDILITYPVEDLSLFLSRTIEEEEYELASIIQKTIDFKTREIWSVITDWSQ